MLTAIKKTIREQQFCPSWLGLFVNPFYFARKGLFENITSLSKSIQGKILDVGCGQKPYKNLFNASEYIGLELDSSENRKSKKADYFYDGKTFPFGDRDFDSVIVNQVFEHIFNPDIFLAEINRVLKEEGFLLMSLPFVWDEHEQPHDYARYSSFGMKYLLEKHGFEILEYKKSVRDIRVIFQILTAYIYKFTFPSNKLLSFLLTAIFISPLNILGELLGNIFPDNEDLYLDSVILAKKIQGYDSI
ncbi:MAG: class I SAM-dependent methyltransferase [Xenococcaceae cyanobacterium]